MNLSPKQYELVHDEVIGYVNGCPEAALKSAVSRTLREYVHEIGGIMTDCPCTAAEGHGVFHVDAPFGGRIVQVLRVLRCGEPVNPQAYVVVIDGDVAHISFRDHHVRHVHEHAHRGHGVEAVAYWEPTLFTKEMPHDWFRRHAGAICDGVVGELLTQDGKPWADGSVGAQFLARYGEDIRSELYARHAASMEGGRIDMLDRQEPFIY